MQETATAHLFRRPAEPLSDRTSKLGAQSGPLVKRTPSGKRPRILFLVLTARENPAAVDQLVASLAPHQVVIHHDARARPAEFSAADNLMIAPISGLGGWGVWGLVEAIRESIRFCLNNYSFDYLQVLSGTCLPLKPITDFQDHVARSGADVNIDYFDVRKQKGAVLAYAYRLLAAEGSLSFRVLRALRTRRFGLTPARREIGGIETPVCENFSVLDWLDPGLKFIMRWQGRARPHSPGVDPVVGSCWFGASRAACGYLVQRLSDEQVIRHFKNRHLVEEYAVPAVFHDSPYQVGGSNHLINQFDEKGHPYRFSMADLGRINSAQRWFGRKFSDNPNDPVRRHFAARAVAVT